MPEPVVFPDTLRGEGGPSERGAARGSGYWTATFRGRGGVSPPRGADRPRGPHERGTEM